MRSRLWALGSKDSFRCCLNCRSNNARYVDRPTEVEGWGGNYSGSSASSTSPSSSSACAYSSPKSCDPSTASSVGGEGTGPNWVGQRGSAVRNRCTPRWGVGWGDSCRVWSRYEPPRPNLEPSSHPRRGDPCVGS